MALKQKAGAKTAGSVRDYEDMPRVPDSFTRKFDDMAKWQLAMDLWWNRMKANIREREEELRELRRNSQ